MNELLLAIGPSRNAYTGPDGIHNQMLFHLSPSAKEFLRSLFNRIWGGVLLPVLLERGDRFSYP
jgi:hypothetical protein